MKQDGHADVMTGMARTDVMTLSFYGATGTVTGSRFLVRSGGDHVLVDAGLFQGLRALRRRNWDPVPFDPAVLDAVVISHAHLDHTGYLPVLARDGFTGPVVATSDTARLAELILRDSAKLQEEDAAYAARKGFSKHAEPRPLYDARDVERVLPHFASLEFDEERVLGESVAVRLHRAGHILGSASVLVEATSGSVLFSGDLGRPHHPLLLPPSPPSSVGTLVIESTYGDRKHPESGMPQLADVLRRTIGRGGVVVIPAFAVDRTEVLLVALGQLLRSGEVPEVPVFLDSPMALQVLEIYRDALRNDRADVRDGVGALLESYQAIGTRGRDLVEGVPALKMYGKYVPVRAEVAQVEGFSVHADGDELLAWAGQMSDAPETTFVVHGEPDSSAALARRFRVELGWNAVVPRDGETVRVA